MGSRTAGASFTAHYFPSIGPWLPLCLIAVQQNVSALCVLQRLLMLRHPPSAANLLVLNTKPVCPLCEGLKSGESSTTKACTCCSCPGCDKCEYNIKPYMMNKCGINRIGRVSDKKIYTKCKGCNALVVQKGNNDRSKGREAVKRLRDMEEKLASASGAAGVMVNIAQQPQQPAAAAAAGDDGAVPQQPAAASKAEDLQKHGYVVVKNPRGRLQELRAALDEVTLTFLPIGQQIPSPSHGPRPNVGDKLRCQADGLPREKKARWATTVLPHMLDMLVDQHHLDVNVLKLTGNNLAQVKVRCQLTEHRLPHDDFHLPLPMSSHWTPWLDSLL